MACEALPAELRTILHRTARKLLRRAVHVQFEFVGNDRQGRFLRSLLLFLALSSGTPSFQLSHLGGTHRYHMMVVVVVVGWLRGLQPLPLPMLVAPSAEGVATEVARVVVLVVVLVQA
jgi:hypothetical protein